MVLAYQYYRKNSRSPDCKILRHLCCDQNRYVVLLHTVQVRTGLLARDLQTAQITCFALPYSQCFSPASSFWINNSYQLILFTIFSGFTDFTLLFINFGFRH